MHVHNERQMSIKTYRKMKKRMLKDFGVYISNEETTHMDSLTTEIAIDNFCISMIRKYMKTHV